MMPTVMSAARAGSIRPDSTKGLAAAPPRKVRRESESLVMDKLLDSRALRARRERCGLRVIWPPSLFVSTTARPLADCRFPKIGRGKIGRRATARRPDQIAHR